MDSRPRFALPGGSPLAVGRQDAGGLAAQGFRRASSCSSLHSMDGQGTPSAGSPASGPASRAGIKGRAGSKKLLEPRHLQQAEPSRGPHSASRGLDRCDSTCAALADSRMASLCDLRLAALAASHVAPPEDWHAGADGGLSSPYGLAAHKQAAVADLRLSALLNSSRGRPPVSHSPNKQAGSHAGAAASIHPETAGRRPCGLESTPAAAAHSKHTTSFVRETSTDSAQSCMPSEVHSTWSASLGSALCHLSFPGLRRMHSSNSGLRPTGSDFWHNEVCAAPLVPLHASHSSPALHRERDVALAVFSAELPPMPLGTVKEGLVEGWPDMVNNHQHHWCGGDCKGQHHKATAHSGHHWWPFKRHHRHDACATALD